MRRNAVRFFDFPAAQWRRKCAGAKFRRAARCDARFKSARRVLKADSRSDRANEREEGAQEVR